MPQGVTYECHNVYHLTCSFGNATFNLCWGRKSFPSDKWDLCWVEGLDRNSTMGLKHGPKAIGETFENSPYFMPWAWVRTSKDYRMAQKCFLQQTRQHNIKAYYNKEIVQ